MNSINNKVILFCFIIYFILLVRIFDLLLYIKNRYENISQLNSNYFIKNKNFDNDTNTKLDSYNIINQYIQKQVDFCKFPNKYYEKKFESQIKKVNFRLNNLSYKFYIYKNNDIISKFITVGGSFEAACLNNILKALQFYKKINNIYYNKDIYILDIGGNIGIYPSFLGRYGYSILSFEPSPINYYISKKNYCNMNNKSNVILINEGLSTEEKKCNYYLNIGNKGNGILLCNNFINKKVKSKFVKAGSVTLTRLSSFIPYLSDKKLALIKIDIEGGEEKALKSGIELINKYHVPFILMEFTPIYLKEHGTDPINFLNLFINNGYKITINGFFNKIYLSIERIMNITKTQINLYIVHNSVLK